MPTRVTPEVEEQSQQEAGRAATRTRSAPRWLVPVLIVVAAFLTFWALFQPVPGWAGWVVFGAIVLVVIGMMIAVNPRRRSPAGGTRGR